ncbi:hypothetical protein EBS80_01425 [bacterium]|nr:hypothetical protein [bacterium]
MIDYPVDALLRLRAAIRHHRDQKGDNRCWLDDWRLWNKLRDVAFVDDTVIPDDAMARCEAYYRHRRSETADPMPANAIRDRRRWNADIDNLSRAKQYDELSRIESAIRAHRDIVGRERTLDDDRALYAILPENLPADFRLPPEDQFLGETLAPHAGCPAFWRSHGSCPGTCHNLHTWGPCGPK